MEREVSISTEIVVAIVGIAAFLSIVVYTVFLGNNIKNDGTEVLTDINNSISVDYVEGLVAGEVSNEMPAVTAYNILTRYYLLLTESANGVNYKGDTNSFYYPTLASRVVNLQDNGSDLSTNLATMSGRVQLEVIPTGQGNYIGLIHPADSLWSTGVVDTSCEYVGAYTLLLDKYGIEPTWKAQNLGGCGPSPL